MSPRYLTAVAITFSIFVGPSKAHATPLRIDEPNPANYLTGVENATAPSLIEQAQAMPAVVNAMQVFASRGYLRDPFSDNAASSGTGVIVALAYSVPSDPNVGAIIWIASDVVNDLHATGIAGGLVEIDPATHQIVASSLMTTGDPGFAITIGDMSKTTTSNYSRRPVVSEIGEFIVCTIVGCGAGAEACTSLFIPQAVGTCAAVACTVAAIGCALIAFH